MTTETMTVRKALTQKKLLDKQISELFKFKFVHSSVNASEVVKGLTLKDWESEALRTAHSLSDKIKRREAIAKAIIEANATNYVEVPKFTGLEIGMKEGKEKISFAGAIARKNYLKSLLEYEIGDLTIEIAKVNKEHQANIREVEKSINEQVKMLSETTPDATLNVKAKYKEELEEKMKAHYLDPALIVAKIGYFSRYIEEYIAEIDSILGHATEVTEITVEY